MMATEEMAAVGAAVSAGATSRPTPRKLSHSRRTSPSVAVLLLMVVVAVSRFEQTSGFARLCGFPNQNQHQPVVSDASQCRFGWAVDACGRTVCTKGPGDLCGGKHHRYGICGEGLMCSNCNRCSGCSLRTFQCFDDRHCILSSARRRK